MAFKGLDLEEGASSSPVHPTTRHLLGHVSRNQARRRAAYIWSSKGPRALSLLACLWGGQGQWTGDQARWIRWGRGEGDWKEPWTGTSASAMYRQWLSCISNAMDPRVEKLLKGKSNEEKFLAIAYSFGCLLTRPQRNTQCDSLMKGKRHIL